MVHEIRTIDAHVGGQPVRLVTGGAPAPRGRTMAARLDWMRRHADPLRRAVVLPPRGHADLVAAILTEPVSPGAVAGLLAMDAHGFLPLSGRALVAAVTIALERGLLIVGDAPDRLAIDTPAGTVQVRARLDTRGGAARVDAVTMTNVPAFVCAAAQRVKVGPRELRVDIAYGGAFHAILDTDAVGIPLAADRVPELRRLAIDLAAALNRDTRVAHPVEPAVAGVGAVTFTGPPIDPEAHLRNVTISAGGAIDRSPGGTATSAVMAVLDAMGLLPEDQPFVHEGLAGSLFRARPAQRTLVGDYPAVITEITSAAWVTGEHRLLLDDDDPFRDGA